ncbi:tRNA pseudouridine synthase 3 [Thoreauomyces humboldtii]|nr:tRNA pseudouridine synthase 3 [Thoreauomyces humboldtii]
MSGEHEPRDYSKWGKASLIERITELEKRAGIVPSTNGLAPLTTAQVAYRRRKPPPRPYDFALHPARPVALKVAYLGWNYHGLSAQDTDTVPTVESHLFKALDTARMIPDRKTCGFSRCGRTDKGVSAFDQVIGIWLRSDLPPGAEGTVRWDKVEDAKRNGNIPFCDFMDGEVDYVGTLNRLLPDDIRILSWSPVEPKFDARFNCIARKYKYFFAAEELDIRAMRRAAQAYVGYHDFRNFCKIDPIKNLTTYERQVLQADIRPFGHEDSETPFDESDPVIGFDPVTGKSAVERQYYVFVVKGRAFLWHQVRCMMAILYLVGSHKEPAHLPFTLLDMSVHPEGLGRPIYDMASELPLVLVNCDYPPDTFRWTCTEDQKERMQIILDNMWMDHGTKAVQLSRLVDLIRPSQRVEKYSGAEPPKTKAMYIPVLERDRCDTMEDRLRKSGGKIKGGLKRLQAAVESPPVEMADPCDDSEMMVVDGAIKIVHDDKKAKVA